MLEKKTENTKNNKSDSNICTVRLDKSPNKRGKSQIATIKCLGLKKIGQEAKVKITPSTQGMIDAVKHLISIKK